MLTVKPNGAEDVMFQIFDANMTAQFSERNYLRSGLAETITASLNPGTYYLKVKDFDDRRYDTTYSIKF
jgi:major membrane immunogen (membrane-anchored lipoprotein)